MDFGDLLPALMFALWALGQLGRLVGKRAPQAAKAEVRSPTELARAMAASLERSVFESRAVLDRLDPALRSKLAPALETELLPRATELHGELSAVAGAKSAVARRLIGQLSAARELERSIAQMRHAIEIADRSRRQPPLATRHAIADRLVARCWTPLHEAATAHDVTTSGPPVTVIETAAREAGLSSSPLAPRVLVLPANAPLPWLTLAHELGAHAIASMPEVADQVFAILDADTEAGADAGADRLARVLLASWLPSLLGDVIGAQLLGPTYLRALIATARSPTTPGRVVAVKVASDGTIETTPPAHIRVHVVGRWLARMGSPSLAGELVRGWDSDHETPRALALHGASSGVLDLTPILDAAMPVVDEMYGSRIDAFGGRRLAELPGLEAVDSRERRARDVAEALLRGAATEADAGTLMAGATLATMTEPSARKAIDHALLSALEAPRTTARTAPRTPTPAKVRRPSLTVATRELNPRTLVDAMLLHDIVLERPASRS